MFTIKYLDTIHVCRAVILSQPNYLERYVDVLRWDDGYLVVMAKYSHNTKLEEEYIDLKPILEGLYIDPASFLKPIKSVRIAYA